MRNFLIRATALLAMLSLASPALVFAAYNDATLDTNVELSVGGVTIAVTTTNIVAETITVDTNSFSLTMPAGSELHISVAALNGLNVSSSAGLAFTRVCTSGASSVDLSATESVNVTVTPSADLCSSSSSSSSGSSSGGGGGPVGLIGSSGGGGVGGSAVIPSYGSTPAPSAQTQPQTQTNNSAAKFSALTLALKKGSTGAQVKVLQQMLNSDPATQIASSGAGSPGKETTLFGALTELAVKKFQAKWSIASSGTAATTGYGAVGPKTRAKFNALFAQ